MAESDPAGRTDDGERFRAAGEATEGTVGEAAALLFPMRNLVDFGRGYFERVL